MQKTVFILSFLLLCTAAAFVWLELLPPEPVSTVIPLDDMPAVSFGDTEGKSAVRVGASLSETSDTGVSGNVNGEEPPVPDTVKQKMTHPPRKTFAEQKPPVRKIRISKDACRRLKHGSAGVPADYQSGVSVTGRPVVSADYRSGVSVTGQPVVSADLNDYGFAEPDLQDITLPVSVDLEKDFPFFRSSLDLGTIPVGNVTFKNGRVYMNGHLLSGDAQNILKDQCP